MSQRSGLFVTGTDTDAGKTVVSAALVKALNATYWKPLQTGLDDLPGGDTAIVARLTGHDPQDFPAPAVALRKPLSPDQAAAEEGVTLNASALTLPEGEAPLVVEGAGGPLVPIDETTMMIDLAARFGLPVVVAARTGLGTISHTLLCLEALARRGLKVAGVVFSGEDNPRNIEAVRHWGGVPILGRIPRLDPLNARTLAGAAAQLKIEGILDRA